MSIRLAMSHTHFTFLFVKSSSFLGKWRRYLLRIVGKKTFWPASAFPYLGSVRASQRVTCPIPISLCPPHGCLPSPVLYRVSHNPLSSDCSASSPLDSVIFPSAIKLIFIKLDTPCILLFVELQRFHQRSIFKAWLAEPDAQDGVQRQATGLKFMKLLRTFARAGSVLSRSHGKTPVWPGFPAWILRTALHGCSFSWALPLSVLSACSPV